MIIFLVCLRQREKGI
ncbi:hypothetical protein CIB84_007140 [Bambusicola thoracicus]|uniref:Uncharacterized protein n=1 Tax=Bambusicola thoracicus TaxID=9083 RepID=A0A2P4SYA9_BAMTH|nr:hypothetical protein CIB84_007140 [Bambusicola thoracicus]